MCRRLLTILSTLLVAVVVAAAAAADGGPAPGVLAGGAGIAAPGGRVHYVTVPTADGTVVEAIDRHGSVLRSNWLIGGLGIPLVAGDGTPGGLTRDGKHLVLASYAQPTFTQFAVLSTKSLIAVRNITLHGYWSFDALSPNGRTIYLIQYFLTTSTQRYLVRAYDVEHGRLYKHPVTARTETGKMTGWPVTRATSAEGRWAYTLYERPNGTAFVHALDTVRRAAVCIDLPRMGRTANWSSMSVSPDGRKLLLGLLGSKGMVAAIDLRTFRVALLS
jgi:hypothetical protein